MIGMVTYEEQDNANKLETYEWDYAWWEHADDDKTPGILYIGDSISLGTRPQLNELLAGKMLVHGFATSKALDNSYLLPAIELFVKQMHSCKYVLFNNGLHGWHMDDENEWCSYLERSLETLKEMLPEAELVLVNTTCVAEEGRENRVINRNRCMKNIAEKMQLRVIDLHSVAKENVSCRMEDGVHYTAEGYQKFAVHILSELK